MDAATVAVAVVVPVPVFVVVAAGAVLDMAGVVGADTLLMRLIGKCSAVRLLWLLWLLLLISWCFRAWWVMWLVYAVVLGGGNCGGMAEPVDRDKNSSVSSCTW